MPTAKQHFAQGNQHYVEEDYAAALKSFSAALDQDDANVECYVNRAATHYKLEQFTDALADTRTALEIKPSSHKAHFRQGTVLFALKQHEDARVSFFQAKKHGGPEASAIIWMAKCNQALGLPQGAVPEVQPAAVVPQSTQPVTEPVSGSDSGALRIKHDHYQTDAYVNVSVMIKGLADADVECGFGERSLSVTAKLHTGADYSLELDLWNSIVPAESSFVVRKTKIDIKLKKASPVRWAALEGDGTTEAAVVMESAEAIAAKRATTVKSGKDWDALVVDIKKEEEEEKPEGEAALNSLFKKIYGDGDDATKRAMMKSYQESGGTVLSTNWGEIGKEKTEMKPPDGMEYKKYEQ